MSDVAPTLYSAAHIAVTTLASASYVAFASAPCKQLTIVNDTGVVIEFKQDAGSVALKVADGDSFTCFGISNANQISVHAVGDSAVSVKARWEG